MKEIIVFQLTTGAYVLGAKVHTEDSDRLEISSPIEFLDMMTPEGPKKIPVPYGHSFYELDPKDSPVIPFSYKNILTGPFAASSGLRDLFSQMTSVIETMKDSDKKIQIVS